MSTSMLVRSIAGCSVMLNRMSSTWIIECFGNHYFCNGLGGAILRQLSAGKASVKLAANTLEFFQSLARSAWPSLHGMRTIFPDHVAGTSTDAGNQTFEGIQVIAVITTLVAGFVPRGMPVVTKYQFGAHAANFSRRARRLDVTKIGKKVNRAFPTFSDGEIFRPFGFKFHHSEDELPGSQQPAQRVGQWESHTLARALIKRGSVSVLCNLQVVVGP